MPDIWMDVDTALAEVPVNIMPLIDDTDFKTIEGAVAYNAAGMALRWHFVTTGGAYTVTSVTPTTAGAYDWTDQGDSGIYTIEIPASGGASINNDTEGFGWFSGVATGILPWRGPIIGFRAAALNNLLIDDAYSTTRGLAGTALPNAAADAAGGLAISDAGGLDLDARLDAAVTSRLAPTTAGRTLDVSATGEAGIDWANVGTPGSTVALSATTIKAVTDAVSLPASATIAITGNITGNLSGSVGSVTGAVGSVTGAVGSVTGLTNATIADAVLDEALSGHLTLGSFGYYVAETHATGDLSYLIVSDGTNGNAAIKTYLTTNVGLLGVNLTAADDAVITAIGALNNLSQANVRTAVGLATANLDTQLADLPTVAEFEARTILAAAYGTAANQSAIVGYIDTEVAAILAAVDTEVGAIKAKTDQLTFTVANQVDSNALSGGGSGLDAAGVRAAVGLATANLDTQLADLPTVSEFNARTLVAASYFDPAVDVVTTTDTANVTAILADTNELQGDWVNGGRLDLILDARASQTSVDDVPTNAELATALGTADDAVLSAIAALNNLSAAQVNTECDTALTDAGVTTARMAALADWIDGGRLDLLLDAILDDTGTAGVALSAAICNKVADHVRRRTQANVEASSDGDTLSKSSQYGAIQQIQKSNTTDTAGLLTIKKTDGTTLGTLTLTSDAAGEPLTGVS